MNSLSQFDAAARDKFKIGASDSRPEKQAAAHENRATHVLGDPLT